MPHITAELVGLASDAHNTIHEMIAEGDKVSNISTIAGTHDNVMWLPATGRKFSALLLETVRMVDGKYAERWFNSNVFGMLQQFGVILGGQS